MIATIVGTNTDPTTTGMAVAITTEAGTITITRGITTIMGIGITIIVAHCSRSSFAKADQSD